MIKRTLFFGVLFLLVPSAARSLTIGSTYYINPSIGNDSNLCTQISPCLNLSRATTLGGPQNVYYLMDGTYTLSGQAFTDTNMGTGTLSGFTYFRAEHDGGAVVTSGFSMRKDSTPLQSYMIIEGIRFNSATQKNIYGFHVATKRCAFQGGPASGNSVNTVVGGNDNGLNLARYILIEDCWFYGGGGRYKLLIFNAENVLLRRIVARSDGGWTFDGSDPEASFVIYNSSAVVVENPYLPDNIKNYTDFYSGAFYFVRNPSAVPDHNVNGVKVFGMISINVEDNCFHTDANDVSDPMTITDAVCVNPQNFGYSGNGGGPSSSYTFNRVSVARHNMSFAAGSSGAGFGAFNGSAMIITNAIVSSMTNVNDFDAGTTKSFFCTYNNGGTSAGAGRQTFNPHTNGWLYPPRVELGSNLIVDGTGGTQMGPNIVNKIGVDGTFWGETGYLDDTGVTLWPWPYQDRIKNDMCVNYVSTQGFCGTATAAGTSPINLTNYIWEAFGNVCPTAICAATPPTPAPAAPRGLSISGAGTLQLGKGMMRY